MAKVLRDLAFVAAVAIASTTIVAGPAQTVPVPGSNESIVFDYFSTATKIEQVGGWTYGNCVPDFQWGTRTQYYNWRRIICHQ